MNTKWPPIQLGEKQIRIPLIQGGMGVGISLGRLAGAVAKEGAAGIISNAQIGFREPDFEEDPFRANLRAMESEYNYPPIFFDIDTTDRITQIETDLKPYAESQKAAWIMNGGAAEEWDAYIAKLDQMNLQELLQLKQTGLDNYFASMNG